MRGVGGGLRASVWSKNKGGLPWIRHCPNLNVEYPLKSLENKAAASEFRSLIVVFVIMIVFRNKMIKKNLRI